MQSLHEARVAKMDLLVVRIHDGNAQRGAQHVSLNLRVKNVDQAISAMNGKIGQSRIHVLVDAGVESRDLLVKVFSKFRVIPEKITFLRGVRLLDLLEYDIPNRAFFWGGLIEELGAKCTFSGNNVVSEIDQSVDPLVIGAIFSRIYPEFSHL